MLHLATSQLGMNLDSQKENITDYLGVEGTDVEELKIVECEKRWKQKES